MVNIVVPEYGNRKRSNRGVYKGSVLLDSVVYVMAATTDAIFIIQWTTHHKRTVQIRHLRND